MREAKVTSTGDRIRWVELPGDEPVRVYLHGLGATSAAYFAGVATHSLLAGHRSILLDLLGHGISDRPDDFSYSVDAHADAVAHALDSTGVTAAEIVAHRMGGAVAVELATRHPRLVSRLVLADAVIDSVHPMMGVPGSSGIAAYPENEFVASGWRQVRDQVGVDWWATMRLAGRTALHRSALGLSGGRFPIVRQHLERLAVPRTYLLPGNSAGLRDAHHLIRSGVEIVVVPGTGHTMMLDNPEAFARAVSAALHPRPPDD